MGTRDDMQVFPHLFQSLPNFHECFDNLIVSQRRRFRLLFFRKQPKGNIKLHDNDHFSVFLSSFGINLLAFYHKCYSRIGVYPSTYVYCVNDVVKMAQFTFYEIDI